MNGYRLLQTKVSPEFFLKFERICKSKGMTRYQVLQLIADTFVRYTDDQHRLPPELKRAINVFENMEGWKNSINYASHTCKKKIKEAIYIIEANNKIRPKHGTRVVMVTRHDSGEWEETVNIQVILENLIEKMYPLRYRKLRTLAVDMGCSSILELIDFLIDSNDIDHIGAECREQFTDNDYYYANGNNNRKATEYGQRAKRKHFKGVDMYDRLQNKEEANTVRPATDIGTCGSDT